MRRGCECNCHPANRLQLSLTPFECVNRCNSTENEYYWQNICQCSNCVSYEPPTTDPPIINQSKMFDFDAIQVMEHEELQQLPEAVNREIMKNSQEIVFDEEEKVSERNLIKLNDIKNKFLNYNQEIFLEEKEKDVLIQKVVEKDTINKENKRDDQEGIEGEKEGGSMQTTLIRLNKDKNSQKVSFKKENKDFSEKYMIRLKEKTDILKNSEEVTYDNTKNSCLKRNTICKKDIDNLKNCQEVTYKQKEGILDRKLVKLEGNDDIMKNHRIYEKERLTFVKVKENPKDIRHLIRHTLYKPKEENKTKSNEFAKKDYEICSEKRRKLHNKKCQLIMLIDRDQKNIEKNPENIFMGKERRSQQKFDRSLSEDLLISDKRSFKESLRNRNNKLIQSINQDNKNSESDPFLIEEGTSSKKYHRSFSDYFITDDRKSKENAISNMKNVRILEKDKKSLQQISKYSVASLDHLNSNSIFDQQLNFDSFRWDSDDSHYQMKQHDHIGIENEKIKKKSLRHRPAKIAIQDKFHSNDIRSLDSPVYDFSSESGFCEQSPESNCKELTRNMKDIENINSVESNLSQENVTSDIGNPQECIKNYSVEAITNINNSIRNDKIASSYFNPPSKNFVDDGNNLVKYTDASLIKEQIMCIECEQNIYETKKKNRCPSTLSRKMISNFDKSEESSSIVQKQLECNKYIQNIDEEFMTQKSDFLNVNASYKYFIRDNECPERCNDTIIVEKQIDHNITRNNQRRSRDFSNSNISCESVANDIVALKHLKQCNSSVLTEEQVYSNKVEDRKQICNSSNNNTSYKNFVNDIVNLNSRQCDDDFIPEDQVVHESEINDDDDMTSVKNTTDCFV